MGKERGEDEGRRRSLLRRPSPLCSPGSFIPRGALRIPASLHILEKVRPSMLARSFLAPNPLYCGGEEEATARLGHGRGHGAAQRWRRRPPRARGWAWGFDRLNCEISGFLMTSRKKKIRDLPIPPRAPGRGPARGGTSPTRQRPVGELPRASFLAFSKMGFRGRNSSATGALAAGRGGMIRVLRAGEGLQAARWVRVRASSG